MKYSLLAIPLKGKPRPINDPVTGRRRIFESLVEVENWFITFATPEMKARLQGWQIVAELE